MNDAKPFGYEILDIKIGGVITRLKSTGYRIDNYLNGNVLRLEELEEERLPYFTKGMDKRENLWNRIISGCDLYENSSDFNNFCICIVSLSNDSGME